MELRYRQSGLRSREPITEVYGLSYGQVGPHTHTGAGIPVGSHIAGGRLVVNSPSYVMSTFHALGTREDRTIMIPDRLGTHLFHNDGTTDFSSEMEDTLDDDGMFCFLGVTTNGSHTCKDDCTPRPCCPIGYNDIKQRDNYWPRLRGAVDYVTQGLVSVYAESEITVKNCGNLHVRVEITDEEAEVCQQIGGVTAVADAGTQPLTLDHRIETGAQAGCAVLLELK